MESEVILWNGVPATNGVVSTMKGVGRGVSQRAILGHLLFLIYINDLCSMCSYITPIPFADDTNLFCSGSNITIMESNINNELTQISMVKSK